MKLKNKKKAGEPMILHSIKGGINEKILHVFRQIFKDGKSLPFEGRWNCHWLGRWGLSKAPPASCGALKSYHIAGPGTAPPSSSRKKEKSLKRSLVLKYDMLFDNIAPNTVRI